MGQAAHVAAFIASFVLIVLITIGLRARGLLSASHAGVVSTLLTELALPALIFGRISRAHMEPDYTNATIVIIATEILSVGLAFGIGARLLRLTQVSLGSFIVATSFASTSQMGLAMVTMLYGNSPDIIAMATIVTQFAVGLPINTLGLFIMLRSTRDTAPRANGAHLWRQIFTASPVVALMAALIWNIGHFPTTGLAMDTVYATLAMPAAALPVLAPIAVGLSAGRFPLRRFLPAVVVAVLIQLVIQPAFSFLLLPLFPLSPVEKSITALYAALPASPLAVAFAARYGGDRELATAIVLSTTAISVITLPIVGWLL
jgi:predicted permease